MAADDARRGAPCTVLRAADACFVDLAALGDSRRHKSDCTAVALVVAGRPTAERRALKGCHDATPEATAAFRNERRALELCDGSPFVVALHRACERQLVLVQELAAFDLSRIAAGRVPVGWVRWVAASMVLALERVHSHRILHLDIKPDNVLVSMDGTPMLGDFGCALHLTTLHDRVALGSYRGTLTFAAPELLDEREDGSWQHVASRASDIWALGMTCHRLLLASYPEAYQRSVGTGDASDGEHTPLECMRFNAAAARQPLVAPLDLDPAHSTAWDFIVALMHQDPQKRLGMAASQQATGYSWNSNLYDDLRGHPFFGGLDWAALAAKQLSPLLLSPPLSAIDLNRQLTMQ
jgi:serine/threonine protein kinase